MSPENPISGKSPFRQSLLAGCVITLVWMMNAVPGWASCGSANCSLIRSSQTGVTNKGRVVVDISHRYIPQDDLKRGSSDTNEVLTAE